MKVFETHCWDECAHSIAWVKRWAGGGKGEGGGANGLIVICRLMGVLFNVCSCSNKYKQIRETDITARHRERQCKI